MRRRPRRRSGRGGRHDRPQQSRLKATICVAAAIVFATPAGARAERQVRVGLHDAPPVVRSGEGDAPQGLGVAVLEHVAAGQDWEIIWTPGEWAVLLEALTRGEIDLLLPVAHTDERAKTLAFSEQVLFSSWGQVFVAQGRDLGGVLDLRGMRVAVVRGDHFGDAIRALLARFDVAVTWIPTADRTAAMREVAQGRADAVALQRVVDLSELERHGLRGSPVVFEPTAGRFAASKSGAALLATLDAGLTELKADPASVYHRELSRLLTSSPGAGGYGWLGWAGAIVLGLALVLLGFIGLLNSRVKAATTEVGRLNADLERRVTVRTSELQQANADLEAFTYSVSHDLRTPLRTMQGFLGLLQRRHGEGLSEDGRGLVDRAVESATRMDKLIDSLLKLSRASRRDLTLHEMDTKLIVDELVSEALALRQDAEGATPIIEVDEELPGCLADAGLMRQVFQNLIDNALKFSAERDPPRVRISGVQESDQVRYTVEDNGVGFDPKFAEDIFAVFRRLHRDGEYVGAGVGLAVVHRIVRRHGGEVTAEGMPGEGATFTVSLPYGAPGRPRA